MRQWVRFTFVVFSVMTIAIPMSECLATDPPFCDDGNFCTVDSFDGSVCHNDPGNAGAVCRASAGICDTPEVCDGVQDSCPADGKSTAVCRASAGICDIPEVCDGVQDNCPADGKSTAVCRTSAGICDIIEMCAGDSAFCPVDLFYPASIGLTTYNSIGEAYTNAAPSGDTIKVVDSTFSDTLIFDDPKSVTLQGGFNCDFSSPGSGTIIGGSITISDGTVELAGIVIQ